jgi:hypothetical protein
MKNLQTKINVLEETGFIPSGLNMPLSHEIIDVRFCKYDYYGHKHSEAHESYENKVLSIQFKSSQVEKPYWITIFEGATYRYSDTRCIIATFEPTISSSLNISTANGCVYSEECLSKSNEDIDGIETIKEVLTAFDYRLITEDETGLYDNGEGPTFDENADALEDAIDELNVHFITEFYGKVLKNNPDINKVKEINQKLLEVSQNNFYSVTVVVDNCIKEVKQFLEKSEAEELFINNCKKFYSDEGIQDFSENDIGIKVENFDVANWQSYFHSTAWYDANENANIEINPM